jgi:hypothetical protein
MKGSNVGGACNCFGLENIGSGNFEVLQDNIKKQLT